MGAFAQFERELIRERRRDLRLQKGKGSTPAESHRCHQLVRPRLTPRRCQANWIPVRSQFRQSQVFRKLRVNVQYFDTTSNGSKTTISAR